MKVIIANWKMNVGVRESVALARGTLLALRGRRTLPEVIICPSFIALSEVHKVVARSSVKLGAQNLFWEDHGAYTGEISGRMLTELGVSHVIIGHSERREYLGETDEMIRNKVAQALENQLDVILCVGETAVERKSGAQRERVRTQLVHVLDGVHLKSHDRLMIAYEPVWAIGTGEIPEVAEILAMNEFIRSILSDVLPNMNANKIRVLYGGSVEGNNAYSFLREQTIDGLLVGGASVKLNQLKEIIDAASEVLDAQQTKV
ncbi:triose-phosphate isomerase [Candidatus Uhrbacteria bacterium]|nr:triose-phosphate isomerase [Candidatus Uhrbacteria bacterium]